MSVIAPTPGRTAPASRPRAPRAGPGPAAWPLPCSRPAPGPRPGHRLSGVAAVRLSFQVSTEGIDPHTGLWRHQSYGTGNYATVFTDDRLLRPWWNTTSFALASVTLEVLIGVSMALVMHRAFRGRALVRGRPGALGHSHRDIRHALEMDLQQPGSRQRSPRHPDPVEQRGVPRLALRGRRRHLEEPRRSSACSYSPGCRSSPASCTRRPASTARPHGVSSGGSRCPWSARPSWSPSCSGCWTYCACSTCRMSWWGRASTRSRRCR